MSCITKVTKNGTFEDGTFNNAKINDSTINAPSIAGGITLDKVTSDELVTAIESDLKKVIKELVDITKFALLSTDELKVSGESTFSGTTNIQGIVQLNEVSQQALFSQLKVDIQSVCEKSIESALKNPNAYVMDKGEIKGATTIDDQAAGSIYTSIETKVKQSVAEVAKEVIANKLQEELSLTLTGATLKNGITLDKTSADALVASLTPLISKEVKELDKVTLTDAKLAGDVILSDSVVTTIYNRLDGMFSDKFFGFLITNFDCAVKDAIKKVAGKIVTEVDIAEEDGTSTIIVKTTDVTTGETKGTSTKIKSGVKLKDQDDKVLEDGDVVLTLEKSIGSKDNPALLAGAKGLAGPWNTLNNGVYPFVGKGSFRGGLVSGRTSLNQIAGFPEGTPFDAVVMSHDYAPSEPGIDSSFIGMTYSGPMFGYNFGGHWGIITSYSPFDTVVCADGILRTLGPSPLGALAAPVFAGCIAINLSNSGVDIATPELQEYSFGIKSLSVQRLSEGKYQITGAQLRGPRGDEYSSSWVYVSPTEFSAGGKSDKPKYECILTDDAEGKFTVEVMDEDGTPTDIAAGDFITINVFIPGYTHYTLKNKQ